MSDQIGEWVGYRVGGHTAEGKLPEMTTPPEGGAAPGKSVG